MSNNIKYHVVIKDLVTDKEEGFMLMLEKGQFPISTLPAVVPKQSQGEVTMGDLTNSSVFVQYSWSGQATSEAGNVPAGPAGIKYWTPTYNYSQTLPTWSYRHSSGVDVTEQSGEIRLTDAIVEESAWPVMNGNPISSVQDGDLLYIGTDSGYLYSLSGVSTSWNLIQLGVYTTAVDNLEIVVSGRVKSLFFITEQRLNRYLINDDISFKKPIDTLRDIDGQPDAYIEAAEAINLTSINNSTITYTRIESSISLVGVAVTKLAPTLYSLDLSGNISELEMLKGVKGLHAGINYAMIVFINDTGSTTSYVSDLHGTYSIPDGHVVVIGNLALSGTYNISCWNLIVLPDTSDVRVGMELDVTVSSYFGLDSTRVLDFRNDGADDAILIDCSLLSIDLAHTGGTFDFKAESYNKVFDVTLLDDITHRHKKPQGGRYYDGSSNYVTLTHYIDSGNNSGSNHNVYEHNSFVCPVGKGCYPVSNLEIGLWEQVNPPAEHIVLSGEVVGTSIVYYKFNSYTIDSAPELLSYKFFGNVLNLYNSTSSSTLVYGVYPNFAYSLHTYSNFDRCYLAEQELTLGGYYYRSVEVAYFTGVSFTGEASGQYVVGKDLTTNNYTIYDISSGTPVAVTSVGCSPVSGLVYHNNALYFHDESVIYTYRFNEGSYEYNTELTPLKGGIVFDNNYLVGAPDKIVGLDLQYGRPINSYEVADIQSFMQFNCKLRLVSTSNIYTIDETAVAPQGYLVSSIYGRYMGSVLKNWIRAKVLLGVPTDAAGNAIDEGQKIRLAVSYNGGKTFSYLSTQLGDPDIPATYGVAVAANYESTFATTGGVDHDEATFWFPWSPTVSQTVVYRVEMYHDTVTKQEDFVVKHIELQYLLNNFKEYVLQFGFDLKPRQPLLDNTLDYIRTTHRRKLDFLKEIRDKGHKVEITMPWGESIAAIPFAPPGGENDGYGIQVGNIEHGKKNLHDLAYFVSMMFKSIDDLDI